MQTRTIAGMQVSAIGLGCMSISSGYGVPPPVEQGEKVVQAALDAGVTLFDGTEAEPMPAPLVALTVNV